MLGLGDRHNLLDQFDAVMRGAAPEVLDRFGELYGLGVDPAALVQDLLDVCHSLSRLKVRPEAGGALGLGGELLTRARSMAEDLSLPVLARAWQMLLRGTEEVRAAPDGAAAAEMLLLRLACVAELPPPAELARLLRGDAAPAFAGAAAVPALPPPARERVAVTAAAPQPATVAASPPAPSPAPPAPVPRAPAAEVVASPPDQPQSFPELVARIAQSGERLLAAVLYENTELIRFEPGRIELRLGAQVLPDLPGRLAEVAGRLTGRRWIVAVGGAGTSAEPTLAAQAEDRRRRRIAELADDPSFKVLLETFPGAEIVDVREPAPVALEAAATAATPRRGAREA
jgi:DNA polymerase-3 subunit gamma/tau